MTTTLKLEVPVDVQNAGDLDKLNRQLDDTDKKVTETGKSGSSSFGLLAAGAIGFGVGLATAGIGAALDGIGNSIELASNKAEAASKVNVLFGQSADVITTASEKAATTVGLSSGKYLEAAGNVGNLVTNLGFAGPAAADMSVDIVQLAADMGSFNNLPTDQAVEAIGAAFRGETEPIRAFGVMLDDAAIKAKAVELGLYSGVGAIDKNAKATATYQLILEGTTAAQGDFARTSDGLANSQRINAARMEDAWTRVGEKLEPIAAEILPMIADGIVNLVDGISNVIDAIGKWADDNKDLLDTLSRLGDAIVNGLVWAFGILVDIIGELGYRVGGIIGVFVDLAGAIIDTGDAIVRVLSGDFEGAADAGQRALDRIGSFAENVQRAMGDTGRRAADEAAIATQRTVQAADEAASSAINTLAGGWAQAAEISSQGGEKLGAEASRGTASGLDAGSGAVDRSAADMAGQIPDQLTEAQKEAERIANRTPSQIASELRSTRDDWKSAVNLLKDDLSESMDKGREIAELKAALTGKAITRGLASTDPIVKAQADATVAAINNRLALLEGVGSDAASSMSEAFVQELNSSRAAMARAAERAAFAVQERLELHSPAAKGPWSERGGPIAWMERNAHLMTAGLERGFGRDLLGNLGSDVAAPAVLSAGGGNVYQITVQAGVGDPVAIGREAVAAIQAYERSGGRDWRSA